MKHTYQCIDCGHEWSDNFPHGTSPDLERRCDCGSSGYIQPSDVGQFYGVTVARAAISIEGTITTSVHPPDGHAEAIRKAIERGLPATLQNIECGFILSNGDFADRRLAAHVAFHAGQIQEETQELTSQELWS